MYVYVCIILIGNQRIPKERRNNRQEELIHGNCIKICVDMLWLILTDPSYICI